MIFCKNLILLTNQTTEFCQKQLKVWQTITILKKLSTMHKIIAT